MPKRKSVGRPKLKGRLTSIEYEEISKRLREKFQADVNLPPAKRADIDDLPTSTLPELSEKDSEFINHIMRGFDTTESYVRAYEPSADRDRALIKVAAAEKRSQPKIQAWIKAMYRANMQTHLDDLHDYVNQSKYLVEAAAEDRSWGAVASIHGTMGKAIGLLADKVQTQDEIADLRRELDRLSVMFPDLALRYEKALGLGSGEREFELIDAVETVDGEVVDEKVKDPWIIAEKAAKGEYEGDD